MYFSAFGLQEDEGYLAVGLLCVYPSSAWSIAGLGGD